MTLDLIATNKRLLANYYRALDEAAPGEILAALETYMRPDAVFHTVHPLNDLHGPQVLEAQLMRPLRDALPDLQRRAYAIMGGRFADADWACALGVLEGSMSGAWLGLRPTNGLVNLRFGEFHKIVAGQIAETFAIYDLVDFMRQTGLNPLPAPPLGVADIFPAPITQDGLSLDSHDPAATAASLALVERMIFGLHEYDKTDLRSMGMERFWSPAMLWYGPGGIGANRGIAGFQAYHQGAFLTAFPDRVGGNHKARFADGAYVASTGWPSITATHAGPWLGVPATGRQITMRVMDWWRRDGALLKENWVFIDVPHVLLQSGFDVFAAVG